jgi:hypothetical protein
MYPASAVSTGATSLPLTTCVLTVASEMLRLRMSWPATTTGCASAIRVACGKNVGA